MGMEPGSSGQRYISEEFLAGLVVLIALAVRLLHVVFTARSNPLAGDLVLDSAIYDRWAKALVWGGDVPETSLMQAPLYPWFVSVVYRLFGPSLTAVRAVQGVLGAVSAGLVITATRRLLRSSTAGIAAGLLAALYLPAIFYEGMILPVTLILFLNALFLVLMTAESGAPSPARLAAAGFVLGLSVLAKPVALLLAPFAVVHILLLLRGHGPRGGGSASRRIASLAVGLIFALLPLTIRNARMTGEFIPLTTGGGINFYIGNNPGATGFYSVPVYEGRPLGGTPGMQRKRMREIAENVRGSELSGSAVSRFWLYEGLRWIIDEPGGWASLLWRKFLFFMNRYERANVESIEFHSRFPGVLSLPLPGYWLVASLGLLGIFMTRERWKRLWLLYGGVLAYLFAGLAFYVLSRYRLPVITFLIPLAGGAVSGLLKMLRDRRWLDLALMCAVLLLLLVFTGTEAARDTPYGKAARLVRLGTIYEMRGDLEKARAAWREAIGIDPGHRAAREHLERTGDGQSP